MRFFIIHFYRGIDVENAIKLAAADDGYVTYDELRENLRKYKKSQKIRLHSSTIYFCVQLIFALTSTSSTRIDKLT